jgi:tetratricopeptide (TPR) repeat protein
MRHEEAQKYYNQAKDLYLEIGDRRGEGIVYNDLGVWHELSLERQAAFEYYTQAIAIFREIGDRWEEETTLRNLGRLFAIMGRFDAALACLWLAASIADTIHKNIDAEVVPIWIRRSLPEEEFERLWSQAESQASRIVDQAIRDGLPAESEDEPTL